MGVSRVRIDHPSRRYLLALSLAAAGVVLGLIQFNTATGRGLAPTPDSLVYIETAQSLREGLGFTYKTADGRTVPLTHFPPGYPTALALSSVVTGRPPLAAAKPLQSLLLLANGLLLASLLWRWSGSPLLAAAGGLLLVTSRPMLEVHAMVWSEPLFFTFMLAGTFLLARHTEAPHRAALLGSAVLVGVGVLVRYAGLAAVLTGVAILMFTPASRRIRRERLIDAMLFGVASCGPIAVWLLHTASASGAAANRQIAFHIIDPGRFARLPTQFYSWVAPSDTPRLVDAILVAALLFPFGLGLAVIRNRGSQARELAGIQICAAWIVGYLLFLAASISLIDAQTPVDTRILSPLWPFALAAWVLLWRGISRAGTRTRRAAVAACAAAAAAAILITGWQTAVQAGVTGYGYNNDRYRLSGLREIAAELPPGVVLYSNDPQAVAILTGRACRDLPAQFNPTSLVARASFADEVSRMREAIVSGEARLLWFSWIKRRYLPDESTVVASTSAQLLRDHDLLRVYGSARKSAYLRK